MLLDRAFFINYNVIANKAKLDYRHSLAGGQATRARRTQSASQIVTTLATSYCVPTWLLLLVAAYYCCLVAYSSLSYYYYLLLITACFL
jgi:hypothetical protein